MKLYKIYIFFIIEKNLITFVEFVYKIIIYIHIFLCFKKACKKKCQRNINEMLSSYNLSTEDN